ncbi:MAG: hypothetical protein ACR2JK_04410 [Geodermatophilaceae bacterium]
MPLARGALASPESESGSYPFSRTVSRSASPGWTLASLVVEDGKPGAQQI